MSQDSKSSNATGVIVLTSIFHLNLVSIYLNLVLVCRRISWAYNAIKIASSFKCSPRPLMCSIQQLRAELFRIVDTERARPGRGKYLWLQYVM